MNRRSVTLVVSGALLIALVAVAALFPLPYVVYSPGPTVDTLGQYEEEPVVQVEGEETFPTEGELHLTTVGVTSADRNVDLLSALRAWADPQRAVVPREMVYPEGTTAEESRTQNAQLLVRSEETAKVAALRALGHEVPERVVVDSVINDMPADGVLEPGDVIRTVDGQPIATPHDVVEAVTAREPGDEVVLGIERAGEAREETLTTVAADDDGRAFVGFSPAPGYDLPIEVTIGIDERIGGPSAGMIFALAIYDTLTEGALLDGAHVAGTGEISAEGDVGPIGGLPQKIAAASNDEAELFLAPVENCPDAVGADAGDMQVVPVENLDEAIAAIEAFTAGQGSDLPSCPAD